MLLTAFIALSTAQQHTSVPYHLLLKTEAKSPHLETATLIQDKRKAFDSLYLVRDGYPKPQSILKLNWRHANALLFYPGYVQRDAKFTLKSVKRSGHTLIVTIDSHRGISAETCYPLFVFTLPKLQKGLDVNVYDPNKLNSGLRTKRRQLGT
jgi:hypothetical protein